MNIDLNIDEIISEFNLPRNLADFIVESSVDKVTTEIFRNWKLQATKNLNSTRNDYVNSLSVINNSRYSKTIILGGLLPNMIERGASAFDMKAGFQKSNKIKYSYKTDKNGNVTSHWYLTIPFRLASSGALGENSAFSEVMPNEVYKIIKDKPANNGLRKTEIPSPFNSVRTRDAIQLPSRTIPAYTHKSSIYEGLVKKTAAYGKTTQNTYINFRRVSENSDPNSWIHKGIKAYNLLPKAISSTNIQLVVDNNIDEILSNNGYGK